MAASPTPYDVIAATVTPRRLAKGEVLQVCRQVEQQALRDPPPLVVAGVQDVRFAIGRAREVWRSLAAAGTSVTVYGRDVPSYLGEGTVGIGLDDDHPLVDVWLFLAAWEDGRGAAMAARDVSGGFGTDPETDLRRDFDVVTTADGNLVRRCLEELGANAAG